MLRLGGALGDGTFVNFLPISAVATVLEQIRAGEREAAGRREAPTCCAASSASRSRPRRNGAGPLDVLRLRDRARVRGVLPWLGWGEAIDPMVLAWRAGERDQARNLAPEDLIREIFVGSPEEQKARLGAFVQRGITTPVLTPICAPHDLPAMIDALAPDASGPRLGAARIKPSSCYGKTRPA